MKNKIYGFMVFAFFMTSGSLLAKQQPTPEKKPSVLRKKILKNNCAVIKHKAPSCIHPVPGKKPLAPKVLSKAQNKPQNKLLAQGSRSTNKKSRPQPARNSDGSVVGIMPLPSSSIPFRFSKDEKYVLGEFSGLPIIYDLAGNMYRTLSRGLIPSSTKVGITGWAADGGPLCGISITSEGVVRAVVWLDEDSDPVEVYDLANPSRNVFATDIMSSSTSSNVVFVGHTDTGTDANAFVYKDDGSGGVMSYLPNLGSYSLATSITQDGKLIAGTSSTDGEESFGVFWINDGATIGMVSSSMSEALDMTPQASKIVGKNSDNLYGVARLTSFTNTSVPVYTMETIPSLTPNLLSGTSKSISSNGKTVVGEYTSMDASTFSSSKKPFIYTNSGGLLSTQAWFMQNGVQISDPGAVTVSGINERGTTLLVQDEDDTTFLLTIPQGPAGPDGPEGPVGPQGPTGPQGPQGVQGPIGLDGPQGFTGPQGPIGITGDQGPTGPQGPQGADGPRGFDGLQGPEGDIGPQGPIGPEGDVGEMGDTGPQGATGPQGPTGPEGPEGDIGATGPTGPQGFQGPDGPTGPEGPEGIQGPEGVQGPQGEDGFQGFMGPQGVQGDIGIDGIKGVQGFQGLAGATGIQGIVGEKGITGPEGDVGPAGPDGGVRREPEPSQSILRPSYQMPRTVKRRKSRQIAPSFHRKVPHASPVKKVSRRRISQKVSQED